MYRLITKILIATLSVLLFSMHSQAAPTILPAPPIIAASGYLLMDFNSGQILVEKNADERMEPASLTKMMTAYIVSSELKAGKIKLDDKVTISKKAWQAPGSRMFIEVSKQVSVEQLMKGVIIQSGNDATIALAEHLAGTEEAFASVMNQYAKLLGMKNSHFMNSTGLPHADHYSTPRDLAFLAQALIRDFPDHYRWYAVKEMTYNKIKQHNRNRLLWRNQEVDGVKTGHTESAGYCLVASALRDNMRLISVVLGTKNEKAREQTSLRLLNYGFRFFETPKLITWQDVLVDAQLWKGTEDTIPLGIDADLYVTVPRGTAKQLQTRVTHKKHLIAPLAKGAALGKVTVSLDDKEIAERKVVALKDAQQGGFWKRLIDSIKIFISRLFST